MKKEKSRLANLASRLRSSEERISEISQPSFGNIASVNPNPPHGEKGDFRKLTITLPPEAYELLVQESARRKIAKDRNHLLSSIIREAVMEYLGKTDDREGNRGPGQ
jgi:hypothetical protein